MPFQFGGTSLLIVVGVALDTMAQMQQHLLLRKYDGFMKKGRVRFRGRQAIGRLLSRSVVDMIDRAARPAGAGKGTQGEMLAERLGIPKIATGDVLRAAVRDGTDAMGLAAKALHGSRRPRPRSSHPRHHEGGARDPRSASKGAMLDGVVRTVPQAEGLRTTLAYLGRSVDTVLVFDVDERSSFDASAAARRATTARRRTPGASPARSATSAAASSCAVRMTTQRPYDVAWRSIGSRPRLLRHGTARAAHGSRPSMRWVRPRTSPRARALR